MVMERTGAVLDIKEQFTNFGASGTLVFGLLTWLVLAVLLRDTEHRG
jgi:hypothetical protein